MKITGVTVLGIVASSQAFHVPMRTNVAARGRMSGRSSTTTMSAAISDAEAKASLEAIGGYDVETGGKPLDPLNLAKYIPAETLRKYETVHCRVAMLACVGYAFPQIFGMFDATDVTSANGIDAFFQTAPEAWAQIVGACGIVEAAKWKHEQSEETTPFYDPFKGWPKTEVEQEKMKMRELKNGRAAMLCWASFMSAALIPGSVPDFCLPF
ncbi:unnamed protein product [Scytosiphon promiscuus]